MLAEDHLKQCDEIRWYCNNLSHCNNKTPNLVIIIIYRSIEHDAKKSSKLEYADSISLKKVCDFYGKQEFLQFS